MAEFITTGGFFAQESASRQYVNTQGFLIQESISSGTVVLFYKGAKARAVAYLGGKTDSQIYKGTKQLFP